MTPAQQAAPRSARMPALHLAAAAGRAYSPWVDTMPMPADTAGGTRAGSTLPPPPDSGFPTTQPMPPREARPRIPRIHQRRAQPVWPLLRAALAALVLQMVPHRVRLWAMVRDARYEAQTLARLLMWRDALPGKIRRQQARYHDTCNRIDALHAERMRATATRGSAAARARIIGRA